MYLIVYLTKRLTLFQKSYAHCVCFMDICKTQYQLVKVLIQCQYTIGLIMDLVWKKRKQRNTSVRAYYKNLFLDV